MQALATRYILSLSLIHICVADISGVEKKLQEAYPDWSVRRAFTAQIIINHVQARDDEKIDNMEQALERAVSNGVKNLVVQPTHLMHGAEYEMCIRDRFIILCRISIRAGIVLLICVPLIPVSIVVVQKIAKKLLNKYWSVYTCLLYTSRCV